MDDILELWKENENADEENITEKDLDQNT